MIQRLLLWMGCLLLLLAPLAADASRGITVQLKVSERINAPDAGSVQLYSKSYALVIGNNAYNNGWPPLSGAVQDAEMIARAMKAHGFDVTLKKNLTSAQLKTAFEEFFALKGEDPKARLFVWFAGHGHTLDGEGYLVPVDAPNPHVADAMFKLKAISLRNFGTYVRSARAKHAFSVFDACFAGTVFESQRSLPPAAITLATTKPVRQFLTSGDANQKVSDNGSFRKVFIRAVNGASRADANGDGYLTASELGLYMTDKVTNLTHARQTPKYGKLNDLKYDQGDFVFQLPRGSHAAIQTTRPAANQNSMDLAFWNSIKDSNDPAVFQAYLHKFPHGTFAELAQLKTGTQVASINRRQIVDIPKYSFTIQTEPLDANVRILNINPRYRPGMRLESGRYHVEVSKVGYRTHEVWLTLNTFDLLKTIELKENVVIRRINHKGSSLPLKIVGASTVYPFSSYTAEALSATTQFNTPIVESTGSYGGFKLFCSGNGMRTPAITNASRQITPQEEERCRQNGVKDVVEMAIGYDGIAIAQSKDAVAMHVTRKELMLAVAAEVPSRDGSHLISNPYNYWNDINARLPRRKIIIYGPPTSSGTRDTFDDMILGAITKDMDVYTRLYKADKRKNKQYKRFHRIRADGVYVPSGENDNLTVQNLIRNRDALGIFGYSYLSENSDNISALSIEGITLSAETIQNGSYPLSRTLYFYIKRSHIKNVPALLEYANLFMSEHMIGDDGECTEIGLIPLPKNVRDRYRAKLKSLTYL